ncbi:acetoin utilization protein AcuC [Paracoccaceae bacterium]|nr:acetoin utilization protein AcuC [Paracoccaceae bacterium]
MAAGPAPVFIGSAIYRGSSYGGRHPLAIPRVSTVMDLCRALDWLPPAQYRTSPCAKPAALHAFHCPQYIAALQAAESAGQVSDATRLRYHIGTVSNPVFAEMYRRPATAAGGSLLGVELLRHGGSVFNPGGGTHHGMPDRANGFCYLNDPVLAILAMRRQGLEQIAYVDIDAHHCDGVEAAFSGQEGILLVSTHEERRWPFTGALNDHAGGVSLNIPLPKGTNDSEFEAIFTQLILPAVARHQPQAIVLQCGADAVHEDPLSRLALSNAAHWSVVSALKNMAPRLLVLGGGGYNPWATGRLWSGVWAVLNGFPIPEVLPASARAVLEALTWPRRSVPEQALLMGLRDPPRGGKVRDVIFDRIRALTPRLKKEF